MLTTLATERVQFPLYNVYPIISYITCNSSTFMADTTPAKEAGAKTAEDVLEMSGADELQFGKGQSIYKQGCG